MEYYPRKIEEKLERWINRDEYIIIKGPRQSGKTTLLLHLKEILENSEYISLEDFELREAFQKNFKEALKRFIPKNREKKILLIDEAQYVKDIGSKLKYIYDFYKDVLKVIVTGSGSFDIKVEIGKHLVGRAIYLELLPLSFEEFILWKAKDLYEIFKDYINSIFNFIETQKLDVEPVFEKEFYNLMQEYIIFGSYPAIVKENDEKIKKELLENLIRMYIERDIFYFLGIRNIEKFNNLMKFLSFNVGNLLNLSSISQDLRIDYKTLENYLETLVQTYTISLLSPFYKNVVTEIKKSKKVYFLDTGLRNVLISDFRELENRIDNGRLLENFVYIQLRNYFNKINFWRTTGSNEIDFIVQKDYEIIPIEVKFRESKISKGFVNFLKVYKPKVAIVFTLGKFGITEINKTKIAFVPHYFI
ncbi:MAG: ATP-binding protein [Nanopusillaceae archaeon]|nr:ATP-binding protein [Candidatus Aenigmarchaeota archaeon]